MKCSEFHAIVSPLERGELGAAGRAQCEAHARECPACARLLEAMRAAAAAVRRAAAGDEARADAALEGFEDRVRARLRRERMAEALRPAAPRPRPAWRLAFGGSLALNLAAALFIIWGLRLGVPSGWAPRRVAVMPAGLPSAAQMEKVYGELETLFGDRLNWVAQCGGQVAMGIIHDPEAVEHAPGPAAPLVALVYWLDSGDERAAAQPTAPIVILTRSGRAIRERIPLGGGGAPVEVAVDALKRRGGAFSIQTAVRPAGGQQAGGSSLQAAVDLRPGQPLKLGELRLGDRLYKTFLAVQALEDAPPHDGHS